MMMMIILMTGKGVVPDDHPQLVSAARSTCLQGADTVLLLGARLNWMLHFGQTPRWSHNVTFIQVMTLMILITMTSMIMITMTSMIMITMTSMIMITMTDMMMIRLTCVQRRWVTHVEAAAVSHCRVISEPRWLG